MKKILFFIICLLPFYADCQIYNNPFLNISPDSSLQPRKDLELGSSYDLSSSALNSGFYHALLYEDSISANAKNGVLQNLKSQNSLGLAMHNDVYYSWKSKYPNTQFYFDLASRVQASSTFSPDVYKLLLFGNAQFANQTAEISGAKFNDNVYETFQFGLYHIFKNADGGSFILGGGIGLVAGTSYAHVDVPRGSLYTSQYGDSAAIDLKMSAKFANVFADPSALQAAFEGIGASLNIFGAYQFRNNDILRFQVADLGFISWFNGVKSLEIDGKTSSTGAAITATNGTFTVGNYALFFDSLGGKFTNLPTIGSYTSVLPFQVRLMYNKYFSPSFTMALAGEYINDDMPIPEISLSANKSFGKLSVRLGFSAFGYSPYAITAGLEYQISRRISIMLGSRHIEEFIPSSSSYGQGYYFSLKWKQW